MIDPDAAMAFLGFVQARHQVWEKRNYTNDPQPWTDDPIVASRKFTNVFRLLDPGSQFVITDLAEPEDGYNWDPISCGDYLMRCFLYRHTGRVEAWQYLSVAMGHYPYIEDLDEVLEVWKEYRGRGKTTKKPPRKDGQKGRGNGNQSTSFERPVFTGAYLVFPQSQVPGTDKLESIVNLTKRLFAEERIFNDFLLAETQAEKFAVLRRNKGVADFMSMQVLTDFGYMTEFRENEFVVPGPGARKGAAELDPSAKAEDVVRWAVEAIASLPEPPSLPTGVEGHRYLPSYMDAQNCLCEFSKYVRYAGKPVSTKPYKPAHPGLQPAHVMPPHWGI